MWVSLAVIAFLVSWSVRSLAFGGDGERQTPRSTPSVVASLTASPTPLAFAAQLPDLSGFSLPLRGACLPDSEALWPNAPRPYRNGIHEGMDLYPGLSCTSIEIGTPVLAMRDGLVIRADNDYRPLTREEAARTDSRPDILDRFRGRQVWIDHGVDARTGERIITRYCHLSRVAPSIKEGTMVKAGDVVAFVGNSGTPEALDDPNAEVHLHFEVRVGERFLGQGMAFPQVQQAFRRLFS